MFCLFFKNAGMCRLPLFSMDKNNKNILNLHRKLFYVFNI